MAEPASKITGRAAVICLKLIPETRVIPGTSPLILARRFGRKTTRIIDASARRGLSRITRYQPLDDCFCSSAHYFQRPLICRTPF